MIDVSFAKGRVNWQKDYFKFKTWLEKNSSAGFFLALVYFESSFVDVHLNSLLLDLGASIHIANSFLGFTSNWRPSENELTLCVGNWIQVEVELIGVVKLSSVFSFSLTLENIVFVRHETKFNFNIETWCFRIFL